MYVVFTFRRLSYQVSRCSVGQVIFSDVILPAQLIAVSLFVIVMLLLEIIIINLPTYTLFC